MPHVRHGAPPVEIVVRPSRAWRAFVAVVALLAAAGIVAAIGLDDLRRDSIGWWIGGAAGLAACAALAASLWPRGVSRLAFDGADWRWHPPGAATGGDGRVVRPQVAVDLGGFLLLKLDGAGHRPRWLPLERRAPAPNWHAMRCALHDARAAGLPSAVAGPAP